MVTIYDVAQAAGVSPKTAARILGGDYGGRPANRTSVLEAARRLGYVRNQQAANLRSGRSRLIGVIVPDLQNPHYPLFYQQIHDTAIARGYHLLLSSTFGRAAEEKQALHMFEMNRVEGIILNAAEGESDEECDAILARLIKSGVAAVVAGRPNRGVPADEIRLDNISAAVRAVAYLHRTGHRRVAFVTGSITTMAGGERLKGFRQGCEAVGLGDADMLVSEGQFTIASGASQAAALLRRSDRPTAILAANDLIAIGAIQAAQSAGLRVPQDVAVIGFGDNPLAQLVSPKLTTLRVPVPQIATDCVNAVLDRVAHRGEPLPPRRFEYQADLVIRESA